MEKKKTWEARRFTQTSTFLVDEVDPYLDVSSPGASSADGGDDGRGTSSHFRVSSWALEIATLALAAALMVAMFATLGHYDARVTPAWSLNVNTVVSILTAVLRACMLFVVANVIGQAKWAWFDRTRPLAHLERFDNASRGIFGAFQLLATAPGNLLALVGTLLTISAAAIGPFSQQAVKSVACRQVLPGENASVPVTHWVYPSVYDVVYRTGAGTYDIGYSLKGNLLNGLANVSVDPVSATCSTGNCTFPSHGGGGGGGDDDSDDDGVTYSTMGVCRQCLDTTSFLNVTQAEGAKEGYGYNYSLPNGLFVGQWENSYLAVSGDAGFAEALFASEHPALWDATFGEIAVLSLLGDDASAGAAALSVSCMLYACLRNYHGAVEAGDLVETVVSTVPAPAVYPAGVEYGAPNKANYTVVREPCWLGEAVYDRANFSLLEGTPRLVVPGGNSSSSSSSNGTDADADADFDYAFETILMDDGLNYSVPLECLYKMPGPMTYALLSYMDLTLFQGSCYFWTGDSDVLDCGTEWWIEPLWAAGNATLAATARILENFALAATNMLRPVGSTLYRDEWARRAASAAGGVVHTTEVCVRFQWRWLVLPAALVAASALLLLATVLADGLSSRRRPIWKSSLLPLLYYGFAQPPAVELGRAVDVRHLDAKSRKMPVHLSTRDGSVGFVVDSKHT